jgi:hypothetical protein
MPTLSPPLVAGGGRRNNTYNARDSGGATLSTWLVRLIAGGFFLYLFSLAFTSYYVGSGTATSTKQCKKTQPMQTPRYDISQILAHPWLRQSIAKYEPMDFSWKRRCRNIDWTRYAAELRMRVHAGYQVCTRVAGTAGCQDDSVFFKGIWLVVHRVPFRPLLSRRMQHHKPSERINFVLTSSAHTAHPLADSNDRLVPLATQLPSALYVCCLLDNEWFSYYFWSAKPLCEIRVLPNLPIVCG